MKQQKRYQYILTLDFPIWPRKLADELSFAPGVAKHLVSVTDLQNSAHIYGDTYDVRRLDDNPPEKGSFVARVVARARVAV